MITEKERKRNTVNYFKRRFKDYLKGKPQYIDDIRDRWTNFEVIAIYEWARSKK